MVTCQMNCFKSEKWRKIVLGEKLSNQKDDIKKLAYGENF